MSYRTEISYTFGIMFKLIACCLFAVILFASRTNAQDAEENSIDTEYDELIVDSYNDEQPLVLPQGEMFKEGPSIKDVIEGVGTVISSITPVYVAPDKRSDIMRHAISGEKVTILSNDEEWFCVRMYNGRDGFVETRNIRTVKVFHDESLTASQMDKRLNVELHALIDKFNHTLKESVYARKFKIIPRLAIINSYKKNDVITVTLEYSAVDIGGKVVPSMQPNALSAEMRDFIEIFFMKMLPSRMTGYTIIIRKPTFSATGHTLNIQGDYAEITVTHDDVKVDKLKRQRGRVLEVAKCSMPVEKLFTDFPN